MDEIAARAGERCTECGTPLEPSEVMAEEGSDVEEIVLRCANGHEITVTRHHDDESAPGADDI